MGNKTGKETVRKTKQKQHKNCTFQATISCFRRFTKSVEVFFQLISAGVLDKADYPDFDEETGILPKDDDSGKWFLPLKGQDLI